MDRSRFDDDDARHAPGSDENVRPKAGPLSHRPDGWIRRTFRFSQKATQEQSAIQL